MREGRPIATSPPGLIIHSDAAKTEGWGAECNGIQIGGQWSVKEMGLHINKLEMIAADLAVRISQKVPQVPQHLTESRQHDSTELHCQNGGYQERGTNRGGEESFLILKGTTLTLEYIPTKLNVDADFQSRNVLDGSKWKLHPAVFCGICQVMGQPEIDLFESRTSTSAKAVHEFEAGPLARAEEVES